MQDFEDLRKRFIEVQDYTGLKNEEFGEICGISHVSVGNITGGKSKGFDVSIITNILKKYPEINSEWFVTGIGSLLKSSDPVNNPYWKEKYNKALIENEELYNNNKELKDTILDKKKLIDKYEQEIERLENKIKKLEQQA
jgi:hypothetical protein